jgi:hypothetical protein
MQLGRFAQAAAVNGLFVLHLIPLGLAAAAVTNNQKNGNCNLQFVIPVCPFQLLGIIEAAPHKGLPVSLAARRLNLDRSDFQSTMGAYEGAFSAEPAAGGHPRGD